MKRDVLTRLDGLSKRGREPVGRDEPSSQMTGPQMSGPQMSGPQMFGPQMFGPQMFGPQMFVQRDPDHHDEPTWEVRQPHSSGRRRFDGRTRSILTVAAVAAVIVNAGAAWTYWKVGSQPAAARAGTVVELTLRGRSDLSRSLTPGGTGSLTVTVTNDNDFPIRITSLKPGPGNVVADDEHRDAGCLTTGVTMSRPDFEVSWDVAKNTIGAFTVPAGLRMAATSKRACAGATFTVPLQSSGISGQP
jgi:hypothetical protein